MLILTVQVPPVSSSFKSDFVTAILRYPFLKDVTPESREWLTYYRKFTLETLVKKSTGVSIEARPVPEVSRSFLETHFEIH